ncbi:MAG: ribosome maturation factor RimP [Gammaproteobacteria bacterium]
MARTTTELHKLIEPVVEGLGYELVGIEYTGSQQGVLRVYIDHDQGVGVGDCQKVSYQVSGVLDVEDPIVGQYALEISSPGLDRPLFKAADFERFCGQQAVIHLLAPVDGRRKYKGTLQGLEDNQVVLLTETGEELGFLLEQIDRARLVPDF